MNESSSKRIAQLDVLRAVAVLLVMGSHVNWNPILFRFGWTGVDLFFCLSGFLVSGLLFRTYKSSGNIECKRFLIRRGFKIYPAYYFLMFVTLILEAVLRNPARWNHVRWGNLWPDLIFLQDYKSGTWGHLWSLGVEEQFYVLLPLCLWGLTRKPASRPFDRLPWICALVGTACLVMRAVSYYLIVPFNHYTHISPFHLHCDGLFFGVLLSYLSEFRQQAIDGFLDGRRGIVMMASVVCLVPAMILEQQNPFMYIAGLTMLYLGWGGILLCSLGWRIGNGLLVCTLKRIGRDSYSIYLWHLLAAWFSVTVLQDRLHWGRNTVFGIYVVGSLALGMAMAQLIELPALSLRERLFPEAGKSRGPRMQNAQARPALARRDLAFE